MCAKSKTLQSKAESAVSESAVSNVFDTALSAFAFAFARRPSARLPGFRQDEPAPRHVPRLRRGRPHAGHGLRAANPQGREPDPARPPDAVLECHVAARGADHRARVPERRDPRAAHRQHGAARQQGHHTVRVRGAGHGEAAAAAGPVTSSSFSPVSHDLRERV